MREATGNLWDANVDAYVITTNGTLKKDGTLVMGKGCAREARDMFPGIDKLVGKEVAARGNVPIVFRAKVEVGIPGFVVHQIATAGEHACREALGGKS